MHDTNLLEIKSIAGFINYKVFTCIYNKNCRWFYQFLRYLHVFIIKTVAGFINYKVFTCIYNKNCRWFYQLQGIYIYL